MRACYYLIKSNRKISNEDFILLNDILKSFFFYAKMEFKEDIIIIFDDISDTSNIVELIDNINSDLFLDLKVFQSNAFEHSEFDEKYFNWSFEIFKELDLSIDERLLDEKSLLNESFKMQVSDETRKIVLKKYYNNPEILKTVKIFLECDMNISKASELLFLHRNTLIQRLDKFSLVTGYNIKRFREAVLIYNLLK